MRVGLIYRVRYRREELFHLVFVLRLVDNFVQSVMPNSSGVFLPAWQLSGPLLNSSKLTLVVNL